MNKQRRQQLYDDSMQEAMDTLDGFVDKIEAIKGEIEKFAENKK